MDAKQDVVVQMPVYEVDLEELIKKMKSGEHEGLTSEGDEKPLLEDSEDEINKDDIEKQELKKKKSTKETSAIKGAGGANKGLIVGGRKMEKAKKYFLWTVFVALILLKLVTVVVVVTGSHVRKAPNNGTMCVYNVTDKAIIRQEEYPIKEEDMQVFSKYMHDLRSKENKTKTAIQFIELEEIKKKKAIFVNTV